MASQISIFSFFQLAVILTFSSDAVGDTLEGLLKEEEPKITLSVLLITLEEAGHSMPMIALGEALVEKGHKVKLIANEIPENSDSSSKVNRVKTWCEGRGMTFVSAGLIPFWLPKRPEDLPNNVGRALSFLVNSGSTCRQLQEAVLSFIKDNMGLLQSTDVVVLDMFYSLVADWLNDNTDLTVMSLTQSIPFHSTTLPSWYYPMFAGPPNPTFVNRLGASVGAIVLSLLANTIGHLFRHHFPFIHGTSVCNPNIVATSFGFDYPRPLYPLDNFVGPIVSKRSDSETLSEEIEEWLDNHTTPYSVVYLSMGSFMSLRGNVAHAIVHGVMEAGYDLLWSLKDSNREILDHIDDKYLNSGRILISKWLPQSTVLRHPSISIAVLHGGFGGINEALIAGVPIICLPQGLDQPMNCARVNHQGLGVDFGVVQDLAVPQVKQAIQDVKDNNCREKSKKLSRIFKSAGGASKAVELIEYYHEIGYDHLIPAWSKYNWNFIQFYNLDVYILLGVVMCLFIFVVRKFCLCCKRKCCHKTLKTE